MEYFFEDPWAAARDLRDLLQRMEERDLLAINREGQRELIALLGKLLECEPAPVR